VIKTVVQENNEDRKTNFQLSDKRNSSIQKNRPRKLAFKFLLLQIDCKPKRKDNKDFVISSSLLCRSPRRKTLQEAFYDPARHLTSKFILKLNFIAQTK